MAPVLTGLLVLAMPLVISILVGGFLLLPWRWQVRWVMALQGLGGGGTPVRLWPLLWCREVSAVAELVDDRRVELLVEARRQADRTGYWVLGGEAPLADGNLASFERCCRLGTPLLLCESPDGTACLIGPELELDDLSVGDWRPVGHDLRDR